MNKLHYIILAFVAVALVVPAGAQERDKEAMMKAWQKASNPGKHHRHLQALVGKWNCTGEFYEGKQSHTSSGKSVKTMVLGGRFLKEIFSGEFNGMPFQGSGLSGYNNLRQQYQAVWADSMFTGIIYYTGTCDASGKKFVYHGEHIDPVSGNKLKDKYTVDVVSENRHVFTMYRVDDDGNETKTFKLVYNRDVPEDGN